MPRTRLSTIAWGWNLWYLRMKRRAIPKLTWLESFASMTTESMCLQVMARSDCHSPSLGLESPSHSPTAASLSSAVTNPDWRIAPTLLRNQNCLRHRLGDQYEFKLIAIRISRAAIIKDKLAPEIMITHIHRHALALPPPPHSRTHSDHAQQDEEDYTKVED
jgi:hypothetical protein